MTAPALTIDDILAELADLPDADVRLIAAAQTLILRRLAAGRGENAKTGVVKSPVAAEHGLAVVFQVQEA